MSGRPPRLATWLAAITLPADRRGEVLGDLEENYELRRVHVGRWNALAWYWRQAVTVPVWMWGEEILAMVGLSWQEARYALRTFLRRPGFTVITVLTLGVGIGANTAIYTVVDSVLMEPLPFPEPNRLVSVGHSTPGLDLPALPGAPGLYYLHLDHSRSFEELALVGTSSATLTGEGPPERVSTATGTPSMFRVLGISSGLGRTFTDEEGLPGGSPVAVLSHGLWIGRFGGDPGIVGRSIRINGIATEVVGVMPEGFAFPNRQARLWTPLRLDPDERSDFGGFNYPSIGRLRDGVTVERARAELNALVPRLSERFQDMTPEFLENIGLSTTVGPYIDSVVGNVRATLWILLGMVGLVLLIACANVANLMMVRAEGRSREMAIRAAVGASRHHLLVRFLTESLLLAAAGGVLGVVLADQGLRLLVSLGSRSLPRIDQIGIDGSVLLFTGALSLLAALAFGAIPLFRHRATRVAAVLRDGGRGSTGHGNRLRKVLVASQMAFALILLVGSGLMIRSFRELQRVDAGFDDRVILTFRIALSNTDYPGKETTAAFHLEFLERLGALPGVDVAGAVTTLPLSGVSGVNALTVEGDPVDPNTMPPLVEGRAVTPGFFEALGIPLLGGRMLERADVDTRSGAVLVSQRVADVVLRDREALGRRVAHARPENVDGWSRIVGVVGDVHASLVEEPMGTIYFPLLQGEGVDQEWMSRNLRYVVKTAVPPTSIVPAVRRVVREMDPTLPLAAVRPLEDLTRSARAQMAFTMLMLGIAAAVGLLLGSVGIYGVISYVTAQRTREVGLRMALGAEAGSVRNMVVGEGMLIAGAGLSVGLAGAYLLSRFMETMLFGVQARDPVTFGGVSLLLLGVSLVAAWLPAARAAGTDPAEALRWD